VVKAQETDTQAEAEVDTQAEVEAAEVEAEVDTITPLRAELDKVRGELATVRREAEMAKLGADERKDREFKEAVARAAEAEARAVKAEEASIRVRDVSELITQGLVSSKFGDIVLAERKEGETLAKLATRLRADSVLSACFRPGNSESTVDAPETPGGTSANNTRPVKGTENSEKDSLTAKRLYPTDQRKQELFLKNLKIERTGGRRG